MVKAVSKAFPLMWRLKWTGGSCTPLWAEMEKQGSEIDPSEECLIRLDAVYWSRAPSRRNWSDRHAKSFEPINGSSFSPGSQNILRRSCNCWEQQQTQLARGHGCGVEPRHNPDAIRAPALSVISVGYFGGAWGWQEHRRLGRCSQRPKASRAAGENAAGGRRCMLLAKPLAGLEPGCH